MRNDLITLNIQILVFGLRITFNLPIHLNITFYYQKVHQFFWTKKKLTNFSTSTTVSSTNNHEQIFSTKRKHNYEFIPGTEHTF